MAVVSCHKEGGRTLPRCFVRCYSLVAVPLPSVLIGITTPKGVLPVMGCCALRCHGYRAILRFAVFGLVKTEWYRVLIGVDRMSGLRKLWCE